MNYVFQWVVPVALVGFVVAWFLKEVPLRDSARAGASDMGEGFAAPSSAEADRQLERAVAGVMHKAKGGPVSRQILTDSGSRLTAAEAWALGQIHWRERVGGGATLSAIATAHRMPPEVLEPAFARTAQGGYLRMSGDRLALTAAGEEEIARLGTAWRSWLDDHLEDWDITDPQDRARLDRALDNMAAKLLEEAAHTQERTAV